MRSSCFAGRLSRRSQKELSFFPKLGGSRPREPLAFYGNGIVSELTFEGGLSLPFESTEVTT
jgi:hypothetical protein